MAGVIPVGGVYLQIAPHGLLSFRLGAGQLLPQHLLPHVDGLQRLLDVEEVLLQEKDSDSKTADGFRGQVVGDGGGGPGLALETPQRTPRTRPPSQACSALFILKSFYLLFIIISIIF